jgi:hypothetical protein
MFIWKPKWTSIQRSMKYHYINFLFFFFVVLGFKLQASVLLGRCSTTWATLPVLILIFLYISPVPGTMFNITNYPFYRWENWGSRRLSDFSKVNRQWIHLPDFEPICLTANLIQHCLPRGQCFISTCLYSALHKKVPLFNYIASQHNLGKYIDCKV